ncbi:membrane protein [Polaribacter pacificus]|uniref:Membrane protein n=1 Tax=Polaribacter pacificus TaxID=1775173 RepID=A0A917HVB0_9FLAO|nr:BamA/TamA family outer membrane protein [Polaribacter pacificus]GGG90760.1 membrane protein [Polaribacter pacificus]
MKKVSFYLLFLYLLTACNSVKRVAEDEQLLRATKIFVDNKKNKNSELNDYVVQKPNSRTLGLPISIYFYNLGNPEYPQGAKKWGENHPKKYNFIKKVFSEKQSIGLAKSYINFNNWFLNSGEKPIIIDDEKTKRTVKTLSEYFKTKGYLKNTVSSKKDSIAPKKGIVSYYINKGEPLILDTISTQILSPVLDSIYKEAYGKDGKLTSHLKSGEQYNSENFIKETEQIVKLFRNAGVYHFTGNVENMVFNVQSKRPDHKTNMDLVISGTYQFENNVNQPIQRPFVINKVTKVNVYTDYTYTEKDEPYLDTISYNGIRFIAHKKVKYNPRFLSQSIFIKPFEKYTDTLTNLTRSHLKSLKNFKSVSIQYSEIGDTDDLEANIYLTPIEKFSIGADTELTHSNLRKLGVSAKFSIVNRNTFRGSELMKFSFLGSFFNTSTELENSAGFFNAWEIGADLSLEIPRFVAPFGLNKLVNKKMSPKTFFSVGTGIQKNIGLDKQNFTGTINYNWNFNSKKNISVELFNIQYIRNLNVSEYFNIYTSEFSKLKPLAATYYNDPNYNLQQADAVNFMNSASSDSAFESSNPEAYKESANTFNRYNIITSNFFIPTIAYTFTYNSQTNYKDNNFSFFKIRVANSGNFFSLLANGTNSDGAKTISDTPIAQYFKTDIEYKQFWDVTRNSVLGFRSFLGLIIPYENSDIPFTKSYFAGGSNDIRAWRTYDLGPGSSTPGLEYNVGSLKFLTSIEYRFDLIGSLKGALFIDAGNIWDITNSEFVDSKAAFNSISSLKQIAVGSGFGARYDFSFLVLRLDVGLKTHEPYLNGNKWFQNFNFGNAVYNIGINYPF